MFYLLIRKKASLSKLTQIRKILQIFTALMKLSKIFIQIF
jgi:hypothetical protein